MGIFLKVIKSDRPSKAIIDDDFEVEIEMD